MRLLFDQNLAARLVADLVDLFPGSVHVRDLGMASAADDAVWNYALKRGLVIVSKDADFHQRSFLAGPPPKVVWIRLGNCTTEQIAALLRREAQALRSFGEDPEVAFLALG